MTHRRYPNPTRRRVLTSIGAAGVGTYGFLRFRDGTTAGGTDRYTNYTLAGTNGPRLLVGWYSTYNGELHAGSPTEDSGWDHESTAEYVDDVGGVLADHPAVDVNTILPGDEGTLSVGLFAESEDARVWMRLAGDGSRLSEEITVETWYDTGIFGIGGCQGAEAGSAFDPITADGATLADPGAVADGVEINPGLLDNGVMSPGDRVCVALAWSLPTGVGNEFKNASTVFDLEFAAVAENDRANPFEGGV